MMNKRPIDVMLMLGSDPNFMPEFCNEKELELYNNLCQLDSWAHPTFTMFVSIFHFIHRFFCLYQTPSYASTIYVITVYTTSLPKREV